MKKWDMSASGEREYLYSFPGTIIILIISVSFLALASVAHAHKINIYAVAREGKVFTESYYANGKKCQGATVAVYDKKTNDKLLEGITDENGAYSFEIPGAASLKLVLSDRSGHRDTFLLAAEELKGALPQGEYKAYRQPMTAGAAPVPAHQALAREELEAALDKALDKKMAPLMTMMQQLQRDSKRPGLTEIIGGLGYIAGIFGLFLYLKSRRQGGHNT
ncbi:MAG: hypothetical protein U1C55_12950 [Smithellaceae bacterium]|nr:hypothetical protein [Smithellaceae bacterium]